jgi:hypothetical protein
LNSTRTRKWAKVIIATVAAVGILVAGVVAYFAHRYQQRKDVDTEFKADLDRLLQPSKESPLSPATAEQLLADLGAVIEKKSEGDANQVKILRSTVAERLAKRFGSSSFDLNNDDNVRLELIAFKHWREYSDLLIQDHKANVLIVRAYSLALGNLHKRDPQFVERAVLRSDDGIQSINPKDDHDGELLKNLFYGYRNHQAVLKETVRRNASEESKDSLLLSFCWCYSATLNQNLTESAFHYDNLVFIEEHKRCEEGGLLSPAAN